MTKQAAERLVSQLKSGKRLRTRFQEEEWGITYLGHGRFEKWSRRSGMGVAPDEESHQEMAEVNLVQWLMDTYRYDVLAARLVD